jgi:DHA2 family multidrug resistance protein
LSRTGPGGPAAASGVALRPRRPVLYRARREDRVDEIASRRGPISAGLMIASFMIAIDMTVVNVSLPHMQGSLSASPEQITWVLTSFIVATAVMTPLSGWLAARLGTKAMLLWCVGLFTASSVLCGAAANLPQMVAFRILQGATGAPMMPLAQAVLFNINPPERHGRAMAVFAMATILAPLGGPVVGAYLTDQLSWRWCFYINVPAGAASLLLLWMFMPTDKGQPKRFDFLGFGSLAIGVAALQFMLDRGPSQDWLGSPEIWVEGIIAASGFWIYLTHSLTAKEPLFDPRLMRDRNFVVGSLIFFVFTLLMFCSLAMLPLMTQGVLGYPVILSGLVAMPRGLMVLILLQVIGRIDGVADRRVILSFGFFFMALSFWQMAHFDLGMAPRRIVYATLTQGLAQGLMTVPLTTLAFTTLPAELRGDGSSVTGLLRNLGGSIGIAIMQALTVANGAGMHAALAEHIRPDDPVVRSTLPAGLSPETVQGAMRLNAEITRQADMVAYLDDYRLMAFASLCALPLLLLLRQRRRAERLG